MFTSSYANTSASLGEREMCGNTSPRLVLHCFSHAAEHSFLYIINIEIERCMIVELCKSTDHVMIRNRNVEIEREKFRLRD